MKIVVLGRRIICFSSVPETDTIVVDLDLCSTPEELKFREEIENCNDEYLEDASQETLDILSGENSDSFMKLNFLKGFTPVSVNGTISYGPIVIFE
jgi:hypothetical protein